MTTPFTKPGYESLTKVLSDAFDQAAHGKGHDRHANGEPFDKQVMSDMARRFGIGSPLGQAFKKCEESQRLPYDAARRELLGAINYIAGAIIELDRRNKPVPVPIAPAQVPGVKLNPAAAWPPGFGEQVKQIEKDVKLFGKEEQERAAQRAGHMCSADHAPTASALVRALHNFGYDVEALAALRKK